MSLTREIKPWRVVAFLFGGSVVAVVTSMLKLPGWGVRAFQAIAVNEKAPVLTPSTVGSVLIIAAVVAVLLGGVWLYSFLRRRGRSSTLTAAGELHDATDHGPPVLISDVVWSIEIGRDYSVHSVWEWTWEATTKPVFAWSAHRGSSNVPVDDLEAVRFQAEVVSGAGRVITLPTGNEPGQKKFLIFPYPPLEPGAQPAQRVRISSEWPGGARKLSRVNEWDRNVWEVPIRCAQPIASVSISVQYPRDGKRYETEVDSPALLQQAAGTDRWSATFQNVAPGTKVALRTRRCST
jgi:hypothetical protein